MRKGQTKGEAGLQYPVMTRINRSKYEELKRIAGQSKDETVSSLIRKIIHNRPVKVFTRDETLDVTMEELAAVRGEIKAIGVNINQVTRFFNTYSEQAKKEFFAKTVFNRYVTIESKIDRLLAVVSKLAEKWLCE